MEKKITLFHGSEKVIEHPVLGAGKKHNDFGLGFYCTESEALAKEWAVSSLWDGFANRYTLDTEYLRVLHLLHDQRRSGRQAENLNIMLKPRLRANYKTGYWEVIFLHTKPLGLVPGNMRARG